MIVYDVEIERCIPDLSVSNDSNYQYCDGWDDYEGMGIAVICAFDLDTRRPRVFLSDNLCDFAQMVSRPGTQLVGFNNHSFDDNLLKALFPQMAFASFDLLSAMRVAAGEPPAYTYPKTRAHRRLGGLAGLNGVPYDGPGEIVDAPKSWQRGEHGKVIDYCMRDVMMLVSLLDLSRTQGWLWDSATGEAVVLGAPFVGND